MGEFCHNPLKRQIPYAGMAHFPGTGPEGFTCGDCVHLKSSNSVNRYCQKYRELMKVKTAKSCPPVPAGRPCCKYFERKPNAV